MLVRIIAILIFMNLLSSCINQAGRIEIDLYLKKLANTSPTDLSPTPTGPIGSATVLDYFPTTQLKTNGNLKSEIAFLDSQTGVAVFKTSEHGEEVWKIDLLTNTHSLLKDINPGERSSFISHFTKFGSKIFFLARVYDDVNEQYDIDLWETDGTSIGTKKVSTLTDNEDITMTWPDEHYYSCRNIIVYAGELYISSKELGNDYNCELWVSNGTTAGTQKLILDGSTNSGKIYGVFDNKMYLANRSFSTNSISTINLPLTPANGYLIDNSNFRFLFNSYFYESDRNAFFDGTNFFFSNYSSTNQGVYKTDGTNSATKLPFTGSAGYVTMNVKHLGKHYYLMGDRLLRDGAPNATVIYTFGASNSDLENNYLINGSAIYFVANETANIVSLYKLETSTDTVTKIIKINESSIHYSTSEIPIVFNKFNNYLIFSANESAAFGHELYSLDFTNDSIERLTDIASGPLSAFPITNEDRGYYLKQKLGTTYPSFEVDDGIIFFPRYGAFAGEPWITTGQALGTQLLRDINPSSIMHSSLFDSTISNYKKYSSTYSALPFAGHYDKDNKILYFEAFDPTNGNSLWKTNGGTPVLLFSYNTSKPTSLPKKEYLVNNKVFYLFDDGIHGLEYWIYNLDTNTSYISADFTPGNIKSDYFDSYEANFNNDPSEGYITKNNGNFLFMYRDAYDLEDKIASYNGLGNTLQEVYTTNSMDPGRIFNFFTTQTNSYFLGFSPTTNMELFKTDGVSSSIVDDLTPGTSFTFDWDLTGASYNNLFAAYDYRANAPYITDGTSIGTVQINYTGISSGSFDYTMFMSPTRLYTGAWNSGYGMKSIYESTLDGVSTNIVSNNADGLIGINEEFVFFTQENPTEGHILKVYNHTIGLHAIVYDPEPGVVNSAYSYQAVFSLTNKTCFVVSLTKRTLFCYDHILATTEQVSANDLGIGSSELNIFSKNEFVKNNGRYYFLASSPTTGTEIYQTDGTITGTKILYDHTPGNGSSSLKILGVYNSFLIVKDVLTNKLLQIQL